MTHGNTGKRNAMKGKTPRSCRVILLLEPDMLKYLNDHAREIGVSRNQLINAALEERRTRMQSQNEGLNV